VILLADLETSSSSRRSAAGKAVFRKNRKAAYRPATAGVKAKSLVPLEDPYGRLTKISGSMDSDFQYAGYYEHAPSNLNLTLFRVYDPNTGKWLSRDPSGERGGINLYEYARNNTINLIDPFGLCGCPPSAASIGVSFLEGVAVGAFTAAAIIAFAPEIGAVAIGGLVYAGLSETAAAATVTGAAGVLGVGGAATDIGAGLNAAANGDYNQAAYDAGNLAGGLGTVTGASAIGGGDFAVGGFDNDFNGMVSSGQISPGQNFANWLATQPTDASAAGSAAGLGAGIGSLGSPCP
jgi:RHS repeat-associated protein